MQDIQDDQKSGQRGAILPLLLLLMVPILILMALVVDLGVILNSSSDLEQKTRNAALSAMASFQSEFRYQQGRAPGAVGCAQCNQPGNEEYCRYRCAAESALNRAEQVASVNETLGERFATDHSNPIDSFVLRPTAFTGSMSGEEGELRLGTYYWIKPAGCPESAESAGTFCPPSLPYFRTLDLNNAAELRLANAVDLRAGFPTSNMVLAQFARFMGVKSFEVSNHARAAVLPRNDMFLLDMSRSMYRDNYLRDNLVDGGGAVISGTASEFAVRLRPEFQAALSMGNLGCATIRQATQVCCFYACFGGRADLLGCSTCRADPSCRHQSEKAPPAVPTNIELIESGSGYSRDFTKYSNLINPAPALPLPRNTDHFSANYRCVQSPNALNAQEYYLIDFNNPSAASSTFGARPEPLFSVLEATNFALKTLRQRGMTVDKTGLIAFDNEASNLIPTNPRVLLPDTPGSSQFNAFENATNILNAGTMNTGFLSKALFPKPGAYSDIFQALREAAYKISLEPTYQVAKNSITIFTDGLQNCVYASAPGGWWDGWIRTGSCVNSGTQIIAGIRNLGDPGFVEELTRRQIAVNMILFGEDVGAHRLIRKNNAGNGCRDQVEDNAAPDASKPFVDANWGFYGNVETTDAAKNAEFASASATNPFLAPNQLYNSLVAPTKGLWLPVLPQLMDSNGDPVIFWNELQAACTGATDNSALGSLALTVSASTYTDITDINGRLRYDPLGQSVSDQMKRFMDQIIQSPYVLVP